MNELLNNLRIQAGIGRLEDGPWLAVIDKEANVIDPLIGLEIFAELIIKECAKIAIDNDITDTGTSSDAIKQYFGIE